VDVDLAHPDQLELELRSQPTPSSLPYHSRRSEGELEEGRTSRALSREATVCNDSEIEFVELSPVSYRARDH
jgi:hypothetical protein